ncbi:MAG: F-box protein, partial [Bacteroidota bacterium]
MKKQLLLCACVAIKSLLASNLEDSQLGRSSQTTIYDLPIEMLIHIAGHLSLRDLINFSQADIACNRVVKSMKISQINVNSKDFFEGSNIDAKIIEILQKCSATSPMNAFETMSILVNNASILESFDYYSKFKENPSLEFINTAVTLCQGIKGEYSKLNIIKAISNGPAKHYEAFTSAAVTLCQVSENVDVRSTLITAISNGPAENYEVFTSATEILCHG